MDNQYFINHYTKIKSTDLKNNAYVLVVKQGLSTLFIYNIDNFTNSIENYFSMMKSRLYKLYGLTHKELKTNIRYIFLLKYICLLILNILQNNLMILIIHIFHIYVELDVFKYEILLYNFL